MPGAGEARECSDPESGAGQWESVWRETDALETLAERQREDATAAVRAQEAEAEEKDDGLKTALAALLTPSIPAPAEKPPLFSQPGEMPGREGAPATPGDNECGNGRTMIVPPSSTMEAESGARPSGSQRPEADYAVAEPLPAAPSAQPARLAEPSPSPGAQHDSRVSPAEPRPEPVADVLLRPIGRQAGADNRGHAAPAGMHGARVKASEAASEPLWRPSPAGDRISAPREVVGRPDLPTDRHNGPAGRNAPVAALRLRGDEARVFKPELLPHVEEPKTPAARPTPGDAERKEGERHGRLQMEQPQPVHDGGPEQGAPNPEPSQWKESARLSPETAPAGTARSTAGPEPRGRAYPLQLAETEPPQGAARLNGQLDLQVDGQRGERVRIRFAEAPGGVRMRVASNDARLAESLRSEWQTLEAALRRTGWDPQPGLAESADSAGEALSGIHGRTGEPGGSANSGDRRALSPTGEHSHQQQTQQGGSRQDARQGGQDQNETRQEWLDLSALRRLSRRRLS